MLLYAIITITGVCTETAYAAEDTTIKLTFKKKSVTFTAKRIQKMSASKVTTLHTCTQQQKPFPMANTAGGTVLFSIFLHAQTELILTSYEKIYKNK